MRLFTSAFIAAFALALANAATINLITNGDFETGDSTGWTPAISPQGGGTIGACKQTFAVASSSAGCISGINPASGSFAAYGSLGIAATNTHGAGVIANSFYQTLTLPDVSPGSLILTWSQSAVWSGTGRSDVGVEIYGPGGSPLSNFLGSDLPVLNSSGSGSQGWTGESWDVTSLLADFNGQNITVNFLGNIVVDGSGIAESLNSGFDNVALNVPGSNSTPEPATIGLTGAALAVLFFTRRRSFPVK